MEHTQALEFPKMKSIYTSHNEADGLLVVVLRLNCYRR